MLGRRGQLEEAHLADLHARPQLHRQRAHVRELQRDVSLESRIDEPGRRMRQDAQTPQRALAFQAGGDRVVQLDVLPGGAQREFAGVQDPRFIRSHFKLLGQRPLILRRIHVGVGVVVEQTEEAVEPYIDRRGLDHLGCPRVQRDMTIGLSGQNVAIGQQHRGLLCIAVHPSGRAVGQRNVFSADQSSVPQTQTPPRWARWHRDGQRPWDR